MSEGKLMVCPVAGRCELARQCLHGRPHTYDKRCDERCIFSTVEPITEKCVEVERR